MSPVSLALHHVMRRDHREDEQMHSKVEGEAAGDGERGREAVAFRRKTLTTMWRAIKGEGRAGSAVRRDSRPKRVLEPLNPDSERPCMPGPASEHKPTGLSRSLPPVPPRISTGPEWPGELAAVFTVVLHSSLCPRFSSRLRLLRKSRHFQGIDFECFNFLSFETTCSHLPNLKELAVATQFTESREQQAFNCALAQHWRQLADYLQITRKNPGHLRYHSTDLTWITN